MHYRKQKNLAQFINLNMEQESNLESLLSKTIEYVETHINFFKLKSIEKSSQIITSIIWRMIVISMCIFAMLFINIGISFWLGELMGKVYYGFLITGLFYLLTGLVLYIFKEKWIKLPIGNAIVKKISN